eukprot:GFUD01018284.1.p1 GENE.GFUD01018284.1~~GFUD01018284.1.p1  ORF type:complete len:701 (+),score=204.66 GFUD01018284.1:85-2103(+)
MGSLDEEDVPSNPSVVVEDFSLPPIKMGSLDDEDVPSKSAGGVKDCSLSPIKIKLPTLLLNIQNNSNNNSLTNNSSEDHNKSFSKKNTNTPNGDTVFKTPLRPLRPSRASFATRSATKLKKSELKSPWSTQQCNGSSKRIERGSISEDRPKNPLSSVLEDTDCSNVVRRIKSVEDLHKSEEDDNPKVLASADDSSPPALNSKVKTDVKVANGSIEFGISYFREILGTEFRRLTSMCDAWDKKLKTHMSLMSDDIQGEILSVCGQARLIIAERFPQFSVLVDNCEYKLGERPTKCRDLKGFWDMIYSQVKDVDEKFSRLSDLERKGWTEQEPVQVKRKPVARKLSSVSTNKPAGKSSSVLAAFIAARRKEKVESGGCSVLLRGKSLEEYSKETNCSSATKRSNIKEMIAKKREQLAREKKSPADCAVESLEVPKNKIISRSPVEKTFEGGFFSIKSPVPNRTSLDVKLSKTKSTDKSVKSSGDRLRCSVLSSSGRRVSGLVSPYLSQVARRAAAMHREGEDDNKTPHNEMKDSRRSTLFDDLAEDHHPSVTGEAPSVLTPLPLDMRYFAPTTPLAPPAAANWSSSSEETEKEAERAKEVRLTPLECSRNTGTSKGGGSMGTPNTPHTKSGKKLTYERENCSSSSSPGLRRARVSLLPLISDVRASTDAFEEDR